MKTLAKHSGLLLFLIATILIIYGTQNAATNTPFVISMILMIGGILAYIILNRIIEE